MENEISRDSNNTVFFDIVFLRGFKYRMFKQAEPYLSIYEVMPEVTDQTEKIRSIEAKLEKYEMLDKLIGTIEQPKLEKLLQKLSTKTN